MGFVYILRSGNENLFKIGHSADLEERMRELAAGNPHPLTIVHVVETENAPAGETFLHNRFQSKRRTEGGREFFALEPDEVTDAICVIKTFIEEYLPKEKAAKRLAKEKSDG